jgi:hypothetical protein
VDEGNYSSAASLLHSLLWSKLAPKYFWVTLLMDAISHPHILVGYHISYSGCRMVDEGNYSSAASLLHSLLWSKLAPKYFWVTLLMEAISRPHILVS